jgi:FkbM family methyltransferase
MINFTRFGVNFSVVDQTDPELDRFWKEYYYNWEEDTYRDILPHLDVNKTFLDIGSWQGPISLVAQKFSSRCICFEPDPIAYSFLIENIKLNNFKNIIAINKAVSSEDFISIGNSKLGGGVSSYLMNENSTKCETISIDEILRVYDLNENNISVIKIDIEGYESQLLKNKTLKDINVPKHISLHAPLFQDKQRYYEDIREFFGKDFNAPSEDFCSVFLNKL